MWREKKGLQTAIIDSKGESFPFDFNLQDVNHNIEVEISPGKYEYYLLN